MINKKFAVLLSVLIFAIMLVPLGYSIYALLGASGGQGAHTGTDIQISMLLTNLEKQSKLFLTRSDVETGIKKLDSIPVSFEQRRGINRLKESYQKLLQIYDEQLKIAKPETIKTKGELLYRGFSDLYKNEIALKHFKISAYAAKMLEEQYKLALDGGNETLERLFIKQAVDNLDAIYQLADQLNLNETLSRIAYIRTLLKNYQSSAEQYWEWKQRRDSELAVADKLISDIIADINKTGDQRAGSTQRDFVHASLVSIATVIIAIFTIYFGNVYILRKHIKYKRLFRKYLNHFGQHENDDDKTETLVLEKDMEWRELLRATKDAEAKFTKRLEVELVLFKNIQIPFIIFSDKGEALQWNSYAIQLLGLRSKNEVEVLQYSEIFNENIFYAKDTAAYIIGHILEGINNCAEKRVFTEFVHDGENKPVEISVIPVERGPLKGHSLVVIYELSDEKQRFQSTQRQHFSLIRDYISQLQEGAILGTTQEEIQQAPADVVELINYLKSIHLKMQEQVSLWNAETSALLDQVQREYEILNKLISETKNIKGDQSELSKISDKIIICEENISKGWDLAKNEIDHVKNQWKNLQKEFTAIAANYEKAQQFEGRVRILGTDMEKLTTSISEKFSIIKKHKEWIRMRSINLQLSSVEEQMEFREKAQVFTQEAIKFTDCASEIDSGMKELLAKHPGKSLFPMLDSSIELKNTVETVNKSIENLNVYLMQWREKNKELYGSSEKTKEFLKDVGSRSSEIENLNQTCLLINEKARESLKRWH